MEDEVKILEDATLLKKVDNKYITDFYIFDQESQLSIYTALRRDSQARSEKLLTIAADSLPLVRKLGIVRNHMSDNELMWWAVTALTDYCTKCLKEFHIEWPAKRANGETWGVTGYEDCCLPENTCISHDGNGSEENTFWCYRYPDYNLWQRNNELGYNNIQFLADVIRNNRNNASFSPSEQSLWASMENRYAHLDREGNVIPDILVIYSDDQEQLEKYWAAHPLYGAVMESLEAAFTDILAILKQSANPILHDQLTYCASMEILDCRALTIHDAVGSGKLVPPADPAHSTVSMWMALKR